MLESVKDEKRVSLRLFVNFGHVHGDLNKEVMRLNWVEGNNKEFDARVDSLGRGRLSGFLLWIRRGEQQIYLASPREGIGFAVKGPAPVRGTSLQPSLID